MAKSQEPAACLTWGPEIGGSMVLKHRRSGLCLVLLLAAMAGVVAEEAPPAGDAEKKAPAAEKKEAPAEEKKEGEAAPAAPARPTYPLKSEYFKDVIDPQAGEDVEEAMKLEVHATQEVIAALKASPEEYLKESLTPEVTFRKLMRTPEQFRGHVVQVRGLLEFCERFPVPDDWADTSPLYRGQISTMTGEMYTFFALERPPAELMKKPVRLTGIFLKRYAYKNRLAGEKLTWSPAVFIHNVEQYSEADTGPGKAPMELKTALLIAIFLLFIVVRVAFGYVRMKNKNARENPFVRMKGGKGIASPFPKPGSKKP
ncbi:MAG: hypothetical protein NTW87_19895 [Planctomycetota bacterium]|nr:hypothetical protein [Planctomycetota bacterium]